MLFEQLGAASEAGYGGNDQGELAVFQRFAQIGMNVLKQHNAADIPVLAACKGFEQDTGLLTFQVLKEVLPNNKKIGVLSGCDTNDIGAAVQAHYVGVQLGSGFFHPVFVFGSKHDGARQLGCKFLGKARHNAADIPVLAACKGFEQDTGLLTFQVLKAQIGMSGQGLREREAGQAAFVLAFCLQGADLVGIACPKGNFIVTSVAGLRSSAELLKQHNAADIPVLAACKGFEQDTKSA
jgi:glycerol-3-phosphate dehydrogenase